MISVISGVTKAQLKSLEKLADKVNSKCDELGLPHAIVKTFPNLETNTDYRWEGAGFVIFPPSFSIYVHYKPESSDHVELGRFLMPLGISGLFRK